MLLQAFGDCQANFARNAWLGAGEFYATKVQ